MKKEVQVKRAAAELERLRAVDVVKAAIARESKQQAADAKAYEVEAEARANFEKSNKATDAAAYRTKIDAETQAFAAIKKAEANLQQRLKEAEGMVAMADAYSKMSNAFGGPAGLLQYSKLPPGRYPPILSNLPGKSRFSKETRLKFLTLKFYTKPLFY